MLITFICTLLGKYHIIKNMVGIYFKDIFYHVRNFFIQERTYELYVYFNNSLIYHIFCELCVTIFHTTLIYYYIYIIYIINIRTDIVLLYYIIVLLCVIYIINIRTDIVLLVKYMCHKMEYILFNLVNTIKVEPIGVSIYK